jgi:transcriptional regulator with XRE-family HTH domain
MDVFFAERNEAGRVAVDGKLVLRARSAAGLTQAQVAGRMKLLGYFLPQSYVSRIERGSYPWGLTERMATALATALGVGVSAITGGRLLSQEDIRCCRDLTNKLGDFIDPTGNSATQKSAAA